MTSLAQSLIVTPVALPLLGAIVALLLQLIGSRADRVASRFALGGLAGGCVGAISLLVIMLVTNLPIVDTELGIWLVTAGAHPQQVGWGCHVDTYSAVWLVLIGTFASLTVMFCSDRSQPSNSARATIAAGVMVAAASGVVLASTLVQMLLCSLMVSTGTLLLTSRSSSSSPTEGMRRALIVGLMGDLLLFWTVVLIGVTAGSSTFTEVFSDDGLRRLATDNPAVIGLFGSLIVISSLCRCGLFPWFGWHVQASNWDRSTCILIYAIGYVPSGIWILVKCQPLLAASEASLALLGGLGTLGAILGAFVAGGQIDLHRRLAYLITSQSGVVLVALGSGQPNAVAWCICHQGFITAATLLLFGLPRLERIGTRTSSVAVWCGSLAMAGLLPFGLVQDSLLAYNTHPMEVRSVTLANIDDAADASNPSSTMPPHWDWVYGLWIAQGLSAFAAAGGLVRSSPSNRPEVLRAQLAPSLPGPVLGFVSVLLFAAAVGLWFWQIATMPMGRSDWSRFGLGQLVTLVGFVAGWRTRQTVSPVSAGGILESLARLRRERMYVDPLFQSCLRTPWHWLSRSFARSLDAPAIDRAWRRLFVQGVSWIGVRIEGLQVSQVDYCVAAMLLATATLFLTLIMVV